MAFVPIEGFSPSYKTEVSAVTYRDKAGKSITQAQWITYQKKSNYRIMRFTDLQYYAVVTEWVGLPINNTNNHIFRTTIIRKVNGTTVAGGSTYQKHSLALAGHDAVVQHVQQTYVLEQKKSLKKKDGMPNCPLCGSTMAIREGKYGVFYSCSSWTKTKCPAKLDSSGEITSKTRQFMKIKKIDINSVVENKDPLAKRANNLDLD